MIILGIIYFGGYYPEIYIIKTVLINVFWFNLGVLTKLLFTDVFNFKLGFKLIIKKLAPVFVLLWIVLFIFPIPVISVFTTFVGILSIYGASLFAWFVKVFRNFGKYSLQLYLLNGFMLVISRTIICSITNSPSIIIMFNLFFDLLIAYILIKYVFSKFSIVKKIMGMV